MSQFTFFGAGPAQGTSVRDKLRLLRVLVSKRLSRFKYDYREEWLKLIDNLSSTASPLPLPERSVMALAEIIGAPSGLLFVQENDHEVYVPAASWQLEQPASVNWQELRRDELMAHMERRAWIVDTEEAIPVPGNGHFLARLGERVGFAALVVPLLLQGRLFGFAILQKPRRGYRLTYEDIDLLRTGGQQVASYLAQHYVTRRLAEAQQFEGYGRMTAFLVHDLKNIVAQQSLLVQNAPRHKHNPAFVDDAFATIEASLTRMNRALRQLRSGHDIDENRQIDLADVLKDAVERCRVFAPAPELEAVATESIVLADYDSLLFGLTNLIRNAQQAASPTGSVRIALREDDGVGMIDIADDGPGMSDSFVRQHLFRPFETTAPEFGMGIGAYQLREAVRALGGTVSVVTGEGRGSRFCVAIPLARMHGETAGQKRSL